ncbi:hypothetical protein R2F25_15220 [Streptomyces sp. UP1A-1]|nr:hypothetical protein [Streptomyces sp. UP1A-1]
MVASPDGKLVTGGFAGGEDGRIVSAVLDAKTGERSAVVPGQQLLAWADDTHLIAWRCDPDQCLAGQGRVPQPADPGRPGQRRGDPALGLPQGRGRLRRPLEPGLHQALTVCAVPGGRASGTAHTNSSGRYGRIGRSSVPAGASGST